MRPSRRGSRRSSKKNAHVCDAGCGIGELSLALKPYCRHVTAVDADALAIKTLKAHLIEGVIAICGDVEALTPKEPYDAMVFCLFGRTEDTLRIAKKQCRGKIFLVKRDYSHHRFQRGKGEPRRVHGGEHGGCPAQKALCLFTIETAAISKEKAV